MLRFVEFRTHKLTRAQTFYQRVFDWHVERIAPGVPAAHVLYDGNIVAAIVQMPPKVPLAICPYVTVDQNAQATEAAIKAGGHTIIASQHAPGLGIFSVTIDPWGNQLALLEEEPKPLQVPATNSIFAGVDIATTDFEAAQRYYEGVLEHTIPAKKEAAHHPRTDTFQICPGTDQSMLIWIPIPDNRSHRKTHRRIHWNYRTSVKRSTEPPRSARPRRQSLRRVSLKLGWQRIPLDYDSLRTERDRRPRPRLDRRRDPDFLALPTL